MAGCLGPKLPNKMKADHNFTYAFYGMIRVVSDLSYRIK